MFVVSFLPYITFEGLLKKNSLLFQKNSLQLFLWGFRRKQKYVMYVYILHSLISPTF